MCSRSRSGGACPLCLSSLQIFYMVKPCPKEMKCDVENSFKSDEPAKDRDIELGTLSRNKSDYGMEGFFKQVGEVEALMEKLSKQLKKLEIVSSSWAQLSVAAKTKSLYKR